MSSSRAVTAGGGWPAIRYSLKMARRTGGYMRLWKALRSRNACKTCALGMGGQLGGMVNEAGKFPEVCKKSIQAMAADMQGRVREGFFDEFDFARLERFSPRELEAAGRLTEPLCAGPGDRSYRAIGWDEALQRISAKMRATTPDRSFFYFSGRSSNEAGFLLQLTARLYGTNNVNNCSFYCHQASGVGLMDSVGAHAGTVSLEDIDRSDFVLLIGANPASNHPRLMRSLMDLRRRGGVVVVVNPVREAGLVRFKVPSDVRSLLFGTDIASEYAQPHIGGDIAFLTGVWKAVLERGAEDTAFLDAHTEGFDGLRAHIEGLSWERLEAESGVPRAQMERIGGLYAQATGAMFCWAMGMTHHEHGVANVHAIANMALLRGMIGRPGAGLLPLRGHSNVQGMGSVGVVPELKEAVFERLQSVFGVELPRAPGMDTMASMRRAEEGGVDFAMCLGGNLFGSNPDAAFAERAMKRIGMTVYLSTTLNTGHIRGRGEETIVLPVRARDEESQATTQESMFSYVRLSDGGPARHEGPRGEVEVIAELARRVLGPGLPIDWEMMRDHGKIRESMAKIVPGYEKIGEIDRTRKEFLIPGRAIAEPKFRTESGRAKLHAVALPGLKGEEKSENGWESSSTGRRAGCAIRVMTLRSEGQFNTVVYEDEDIYRGQTRRDVIMMNPADIERFGLKVDERVTVRTQTGAMPDIVVRALNIREGNAAMYYPEANALVPRTLDARSKTPAFKSFAATIEKSRRLPVVGVKEGTA
ncbi:MAG: histidine kinase [Phycisphaeraceae bacterium]|nr:MAG: histidine kinase [Phycisphaeraceae bacterium]